MTRAEKLYLVLMLIFFLALAISFKASGNISELQLIELEIRYHRPKAASDAWFKARAQEVYEFSGKYNWHWAAIIAWIDVESDWLNVKSRVDPDSVGLSQLTRQAERWVLRMWGRPPPGKVDQRWHPRYNLEVGLRYLWILNGKYARWFLEHKIKRKECFELTILEWSYMAYNCGPGRVDKWLLGKPLTSHEWKAVKRGIQYAKKIKERAELIQERLEGIRIEISKKGK